MSSMSSMPSADGATGLRGHLPTDPAQAGYPPRIVATGSRAIRFSLRSGMVEYRGHGIPVGGGREGGPGVLGSRGARRDVLEVGRSRSGLTAQGEGLPLRGSRGDRASRPAGNDAADYEFTRADRGGRPGVDRGAVALGHRYLVQRARRGHARVVG